MDLHPLFLQKHRRPSRGKGRLYGKVVQIYLARGGSVLLCAQHQHYALESWTHSYIGLVALFGLVFACGLPGWALVRWLFNFMERRRDKDIAEIASEVKRELTQ